MPEGALSSAFKGLVEDVHQIGGNIAESIARILRKTADKADGNLARSLDAEAQNKQSFLNIANGDAIAEDAALSSSISDRLNLALPLSDPLGYHELSEAEQALRARRIIGSRLLNPDGHANAGYRVKFDDGTSGAYKPIVGEDASLRQGIPGDLANREVTASWVNEMFGFDRVPTTTMVDGPHGPGSVQQWVEGDDSLPHDQYPRVQQEQMAVFDYVIGNTDRHLNNYLTDSGGNIVAIDHGYSFPESPDPRYGIRSDFVGKNLNTPLSDEVMGSVRTVDPDQMRSMLQAAGLSEPAIDGVIARLNEVRARGMITGEAWPGLINGALAPPATELTSNPLRLTS